MGQEVQKKKREIAKNLVEVAIFKDKSASLLLVSILHGAPASLPYGSWSGTLTSLDPTSGAFSLCCIRYFRPPTETIKPAEAIPVNS